MDYKVTYSPNSKNNYTVKIAQKTKVVYPQKLDDLLDVEISEVNGNINDYVLMFNSTTQTWQAVNPDKVLSAASTEPVQPGLPTDFTTEVADEMDILLDNRIDVDAGNY